MNEPKLRFKEFNDEWQEVYIKDISSSQLGGGTPSTKNKEYWQGNIPWLRSSDLKENDVNSVDVERYVNEKAIKDTATKLIPKDSIAVVTRVGVGKLAYIKNEYATSQDFLSLTGLKCDPKFLAYNLYVVINKEKQKMQGTSIKGITKDYLVSRKINIPNSLEEQQKIGSFFTDLDNQIKLQSDKLETLKRDKKGYLQKMFPSDDSNKPKLRLKGFSDEWKTYPIADLVNKFDESRIPVKEKNREKGDTPYYGANGVQDYVNGYTHDGEYILIAEDGANSIKDYPIYTTNGKIWVNNHAHVLQGKENFTNTKFMSYLLGTLNFRTYLTGSGRYKLNASIMMNIKAKIPSLKEQQMIGMFFENLDKQIELQQRKVTDLKNQKKAYLQKMFI